jgi:hypothetical protein
MKKLLLALSALSILSVSALFAGQDKDCKKCAGDKDAKCTCSQSCDSSKEKDKGCCTKDGKDAKPAPSTDKKS